MTQTNTDVIVRELVADTIDVRESAEGRRVELLGLGSAELLGLGSVELLGLGRVWLLGECAPSPA